MYKNFSDDTVDALEEKLDDFLDTLEIGQLIEVSPVVLTVSGKYTVSCKYNPKEN